MRILPGAASAFLLRLPLLRADWIGSPRDRSAIRFLHSQKRNRQDSVVWYFKIHET